jgi:hypothetical protein
VMVGRISIARREPGDGDSGQRIEPVISLVGEFPGEFLWRTSTRAVHLFGKTSPDSRLLMIMDRMKGPRLAWPSIGLKDSGRESTDYGCDKADFYVRFGISRNNHHIGHLLV